MKSKPTCILAGSFFVIAIGFAATPFLSLIFAAFHRIPPGVSVSLARECSLALVATAAFLVRLFLRR